MTTGDLELRVRVLEAWDDVDMRLPAETSIGDLKRRALRASHIEEDASLFVVKFRGAEIRDETMSLADESIPAGSAIMVMRRRRMPVR